MFSDLAWLPKPPHDFRQRCATLANGTEAGGREIMQLAAFGLDDTKLRLLAKAIKARQGRGDDLSPLVPFRLGLIGNGTLDLLVPALVASAARFGVALECFLSAYDQVLEQAVDPLSDLHQARPDAVLLAVDYRGLPWRIGCLEAEDAAREVAGAFDYITAIRAAVHEHSNVSCLLQTLAAPVEGLFGSLDRVVPGTPRHMVDAFNQRLIESLNGTPDVIFDVASLAETVGLGGWHAPSEWNLAKLPFASEHIPLFSDHLARVIGAMRGKSRRCLVLDLDNTLWGGVIGDDGIQGITLAQGDATGEAYLGVHRLAINLRARGILLAVCSKNNDLVARNGFDHPEMLLRLEDIAVFQANWHDKATNIRAIANELSLGLDTIVFLDDNPVERDFVRTMLPEVAVPELPDDPALHARTLASAGYFEAITYSAEDRARADFYQNSGRRVALQGQHSNLQDYLSSLEQKITFQPFNAIGRSRICQLINKSNQFNLTTRRYTVPEIERAERDCFTLQARLSDRFGDNGMISAIICREPTQGTWIIDTWLMSCRVLGRGVEAMIFREIVLQASESNVTRLVGLYVPTSRNAMVRDHYGSLGFTCIERLDSGETHWEYLVEEAELPAAQPMEVKRFYPEASIAS